MHGVSAQFQPSHIGAGGAALRDSLRGRLGKRVALAGGGSDGGGLGDGGGVARGRSLGNGVGRRLWAEGGNGETGRQEGVER